MKRIKPLRIKKLTKIIELMQKLLCESNNEKKIPPEIIKTIKPKISTQLNNAFCFKPASKKQWYKKRNLR